MAKNVRKLKAAGCSGEPTLAFKDVPSYKAGSPESSSIARPGTAGTKLIVEGFVFDSKCKPIAHAWIDFWQADGNGHYDDAGFNLRGHQFTDGKGHYRLETVMPSHHGHRTPHIHVKVRANDVSPTLITQIFFPGAAKNEIDGIFNRSLLVDLAETKDGQKATFNFVVEAG
jgi:protocatechuate 3,4-dioxygenase beta subunit